MIEALIEKGHAYVAGGDVYYDVGSFADYGKLSGRKVEDQEAGTRVEVESNKRHPADFALWKHAHDEHILKWRSPWGWGFPGWHIECSAMANKYLGSTFDMHGGGIDNIFPHNECEIAQSEAANGQPFARYWLLTGSLTVDGVKMSKSLGNFTTVKDALERYPAEAIRTFVLSGHYSNPIDFSEDAIVAAQKGLERILGAVSLTREHLRDAPEKGGVQGFQDVVEEHRARAVAAMDDDFNSPAAIGVLQDFTREVNNLLNSGDTVDRPLLDAIDSLYREIGGDVLGIIPDQMARGADAEREEGLIRMLLDMRQQFRDDKQFDKSDEIRDRLADLGVTIEDRADGTIFRLK
jgi:cysteinyl-tRNA synthetase